MCNARCAGSLWTARIFFDNPVFASPVSTYTRQGCVLVPEGARADTRRMSSITERSTGTGRKARSERREVIAALTAAVCAGVGVTAVLEALGSVGRAGRWACGKRDRRKRERNAHAPRSMAHPRRTGRSRTSRSRCRPGPLANPHRRFAETIAAGNSCSAFPRPGR